MLDYHLPWHAWRTADPTAGRQASDSVSTSATRSTAPGRCAVTPAGSLSTANNAWTRWPPASPRLSARA